jgi:hypothetical protein
MIIKKIEKELSKNNFQIQTFENGIYNFRITHNNSPIGYGWEVNYNNTVLGFWGVMGKSFYETPVSHDCLINFENLFTEEKKTHELHLLNNFQIYISENYYWYSPPCRNILGYDSIPLNDVKPLIEDLNNFINLKHNISNWYDEYEKSNHWRLNNNTTPLES